MRRIKTREQSADLMGKLDLGGFLMNLSDGQQQLQRLQAPQTLTQTQDQFKKLQSAMDCCTRVCR